ncbi:MAG: hypothetical protein KKH52_02850, partial [Nanoarchaeota archaeon]|nr:hypothetical protein [Nanoarchaeota archaeon]
AKISQYLLNGSREAINLMQEDLFLIGDALGKGEPLEHYQGRISTIVDFLMNYDSQLNENSFLEMKAILEGAKKGANQERNNNPLRLVSPHQLCQY